MWGGRHTQAQLNIHVRVPPKLDQASVFKALFDIVKKSAIITMCWARSATTHSRNIVRIPMGRPAKVLEAADVRRLLSHARNQRNPARNHAMIMLSFKAGLRACEIAGLDWPMILRPDGWLSAEIAVASTIAKNRPGSRIPINPQLRYALAALHRDQGRPLPGAVILSERGAHMSARSVVNWFR